jgi:hypothetical protein
MSQVKGDNLEQVPKEDFLVQPLGVFVEQVMRSEEQQEVEEEDWTDVGRIDVTFVTVWVMLSE